MRRIAIKLATILCVTALLFVVGTILLPAVLGIQRYVITGGSMTGTIPKGAVIYSKVTPVERLEVGDIITFHPPGYSTAVTHRIIAVESGPDGQRAFRTKGDFNEVADLEPDRAERAAAGQVSLPRPALRLRARSARRPLVRLALIGLPALLIALSLLWFLWAQAGEELSGQLEDEGMPHDARSRA